MAIIRESIELDSHFTTIPNAWLRDGRISLKARGLLAMILSHRVGWRITLASLAKQNPEGRDAITSAIKELEEYGYMKRRRTHDERGKFAGFDYILTSAPFSENPHMYADYPNTGEPNTGEPNTGNPPPKKTISQEEQEEENHLQEPAASAGPGQGELVPTKPAPTHTDFWPPATPKDAANYIYYATGKAVPFMGTLKIIERLNNAGRALTALAQAGETLYRNGRPITLTTLGQAVDGYQRQDPYQSAAEKQQQMAQVYQSLKAQTSPAPPPAPVIGPYTLEETPY